MRGDHDHQDPDTNLRLHPSGRWLRSAVWRRAWPTSRSARCRHRLDVLRHFLRLRDLGSATFIIKALTGGIAGLLFHRFKNTLHSKKGRYAALAIGGIVGEAIMVIGYFLYETGLAALGSGALNQASIAAGIASSATGIPFNIVQGVVGIILSLILLPVLSKIPDVRDWIER